MCPAAVSQTLASARLVRRISSVSLLSLFEPSLRGRAAERALEWQDQIFTFGEIDAWSNRIARELADRGLAAGDRLALYLPNRPEYIALVLGCLKAGVIVVPINVLYKEREAAHIVNDAAPRAVVVEGTAPAPGAHAWRLDALMGNAAGRDAAPIGSHVSSESPAALIYTSGTTGAAKGAVLTHGNFAANAATLVEAWRLGEGDRLLLALPLFHVHGLGNGVMCWLACGCLARLLPRFEQQSAAAQFIRFRPTVFFGVPTMYVRLAEALQSESAGDRLRNVRLFCCGSAPLAPETFHAFAAATGHQILERYGMTETGMLLSNPYAGERLPGTVGTPLPGVALRIVDRDDNELPAGEEGELHVRGSNVFAGYWRDAAKTAESFAVDDDGNRWFRTGDLGRVDPATGHVTLLGRGRELILRGGFNVYPREVEEVLELFPAVREAAVVGRPHPEWGEVPVAFLVVEVEVEVDEAALLAHCAAELARFKLPVAFRYVEALPRNALGKVQKHLLPP